MSYDKKKRVRYQFPVFDFGGGAALTYAFRAPSGMQGKVRDVGVMTTEIFATDTTAGSVAVGTPSDPDAYALLNIPDASADDDCIDTTDDTDAIIDEDIPDSLTADGRLMMVTLTNGTDSGTVSGQGLPFVEIEWF